jgi:type IV pilus assembly protein PilE
MSNPRPLSPPRHRRRGFALIEALIVLAVIALLASIALPSYQDVVRKSGRVDAMTALWSVHLTQERWRANRSAYATRLSAAPTASPAGLGLPATTAGGHYTLAIDAADARGFSVTATAVEGSSQAGDAGCQRLRLVVDRGQVVYTAAGPHGDFDDAAGRRCWGR